MNTKTIKVLIAGMFCLTLIGCGIHRKEVRSVGGGYSVVVHRRGVMHVENRAELQHREQNQKSKVVWPLIWDKIIEDETAIIIGRVGKVSRLMAFQPPGPVVDITDQVLEQMAKEQGRSFSQLHLSTSISSFKKDDQGVTFAFAFTGWPVHEIRLSWGQIANIMLEVKDKGIERKDLAWGIIYLEKEVTREIQK